MKRLLVLLIDAFRYDYLSEEKTPFLYSMSQDTFCAPLKTILGYSDAIDATIFTSVYPQDHGHWIMHKYSPETSPFKIFKILSFIDYFPSNFIVRGIKFVLSATVCRMLAKRNGYSYLSTHNIPYRAIGYFDWTSKKPLLAPHPFKDYPTLFDILRVNKIKYSFIDAAKLSLATMYSSSVKVRDKLAEAIQALPQDTQLTFVYLHHLDHFAHRHTINSPRFQAELRNMDVTVEMAIRYAKQKFGEETTVMVFSDHGMADTTRFINLNTLIRDKSFGRDYLLFLDSTMIHIWYLDPTKKDEIRKRIAGLGCGRFLTDPDLMELKIKFNNRDFGDEIYLLETGYSIFPNFMSWLKPYAMHAYHPDDTTQLGFLVMNNVKPNKELTNLAQIVDLAPTILDTLGINIPSHFIGKSILKHEDV